MLEGIFVMELKKNVDERGSLTEIMRTDWKELLKEDEILQANLSISHPDIVRAWHKHERGQVDYFLVLKGTLKICVYDENTMELNEIISNEEKLQIVRVPGKYWHGFKVIGDKPATLVYFTTKYYDYKNPDEIRKEWNDLSVVPKSINGRANDPRCGKPWDWFYKSFK